MRKSGGGLQARPAWRPSQLRKSNPADSGMWKPIKGRRLSPRLPVVHADSRSTPAPLPAPKHSPAPVTRTQTHTHARHTPSGPCSHPSPFSKNSANSTAVRGAGFLGSAEPWAPQLGEGTPRRAEGGSRRGSLTYLGGTAALPISPGPANGQGRFCGQILTQPSLRSPKGTGWLACQGRGCLLGPPGTPLSCAQGLPSPWVGSTYKPP